MTEEDIVDLVEKTIESKQQGDISNVYIFKLFAYIIYAYIYISILFFKLKFSKNQRSQMYSYDATLFHTSKMGYKTESKKLQ